MKVKITNYGQVIDQVEYENLDQRDPVVSEEDLIFFKAEGEIDGLENFNANATIITKLGDEEWQYEKEGNYWFEINDSQTPIKIEVVDTGCQL